MYASSTVRFGLTKSLKMSSTVWWEGVEKTRVLIAPDSACGGNKPGELLTLRHPKSENGTCYLFNNDMLQEIQWFKQSYGDDPGKFRQLDEVLFVEGYPEYQHLSSLAEKCMEIVCQTQEVGSMKFYRLDNSKVLAWLTCKVRSLKKALPALDKNYAAQDEKQTLVDAVSIVGEYLKTEPWLKLLYDHLGLEFVDPTTKESNTETFPNANENKMDYSNSLQERANKKTGKPEKQTKQAKVETGSKNIRDMFSRASKKKVGLTPTVFYIPGFITDEEQTQLLNHIYGGSGSKWKTLKNRRLQNWGGMVHEKGLVPQELPSWLTKITEKIHESTGLFPSAINHVLINEYHPDQGIMPHQDGPAYFPVVAILSLGSPVVMDFSPHLRLRSSDDDDISRDQSGKSGVPERDDKHSFSVLMMPRSLLIFKDDAYSDYLHGISDSPTQCYKQVINEAEALSFSENSSGEDGDNKILHRDQTRVSLTCRLVPKILDSPPPMAISSPAYSRLICSYSSPSPSPSLSPAISTSVKLNLSSSFLPSYSLSTPSAPHSPRRSFTVRAARGNVAKKYDEIDAAPEERARGITINTATIYELMDAVDSYIPIPQRQTELPFLLAVEDVFSITGRGTVATGRVERGTVKVGETVDLVGLRETRNYTVTGVEMFQKILDEALAGDNVGLLLRGIQKADIQRGMVLAKPGSITPHTKFEAIVYVLKKEEGGRHSPFFAGYRPQFYMRTTDVTGKVTKIMNDKDEESKMVMPGDRVKIVVELIVPVACEQGMRFAIREGGKTVGAGVIQSIIE
ncbi:hypothetical protein HID58_041223 [Brassica napus]|uniref:Fe2OG dioxygenase domain-containing protein n=1 Tax=Brassica napus TaxID=3708 RepID=A0ABQ8BBT4_BRANA|nr:hypothetical protein HID58_041223 [Brassica napus]